MIKIAFEDFKDYMKALDEVYGSYNSCKCDCKNKRDCAVDNDKCLRESDYLSDKERLLKLCDEMMASMGYKREKTATNSKAKEQKETEEKIKVEKPKCKFCAGGNCIKGSLLYRKVNEIDGMKFVPVVINNCPVCGRQL